MPHSVLLCHSGVEVSAFIATSAPVLLSSWDPKCLSVLTYARFVNAEINVDYCDNPCIQILMNHC